MKFEKPNLQSYIGVLYLWFFFSKETVYFSVELACHNLYKIEKHEKMNNDG